MLKRWWSGGLAVGLLVSSVVVSQANAQVDPVPVAPAAESVSQPAVAAGTTHPEVPSWVGNQEPAVPASEFLPLPERFDEPVEAVRSEVDLLEPAARAAVGGIVSLELVDAEVKIGSGRERYVPVSDLTVEGAVGPTVSAEQLAIDERLGDPGEPAGAPTVADDVVEDDLDPVGVRRNRHAPAEEVTGDPVAEPTPDPLPAENPLDPPVVPETTVPPTTAPASDAAPEDVVEADGGGEPVGDDETVEPDDAPSEPLSADSEADQPTEPEAVDPTANEGGEVEPVIGEPATQPVSVVVLDESEASRLGLEKVAFTLTAPLARSIDDERRVRVTIDYSSFRDAFGADWAGRLNVVRFEPCFLEGAKDCLAPSPLADGRFDVVNDVVAGTISFSLEPKDLEAIVSAVAEVDAGVRERRSGTTGGPGWGLSAGALSQSGNYATTDLAATGQWSVGAQSGNFEYSYPIDVPAPPNGPVPSVALSYSSQAIDGLTAAQNTQGGKLGPGWSMGEMFIERRYKSCFNDGGGTGDLCFVDDNFTISMDGVSGELAKESVSIPTANWSRTAYRANNANGWVFYLYRRTNLAGSRGSYGVDNDLEYWTATAPDGTAYWFGYGRRTGDYSPNSDLQSNWTVPVRGLQSGEPCYNLSSRWCHQTYRWNLDRIESPTGQLANYVYVREQNFYGILGQPYSSQPYVSGGRLERVDYGLTAEGADASMAEGTATRTHEVDFKYNYRCDAPTTTCAAPTKTNGSDFPDIPNDQICTGNPCTKYAPTFFDRTYLSGVITRARTGDANGSTTGTAMNPVKYYPITVEWIDTDGSGPDPQRLWFRKIATSGYHYKFGWGGSGLGDVWFGGIGGPKPNRVDYNTSAGVTQMKYWRVGLIRDELGSLTQIDYAQPKQCTKTNLVSSQGWQGFNYNTWSCFAQWWWPTQSVDCRDYPNNQPPSGYVCAGFGVWHKYVVDKITVKDLTGQSPSLVTSYDYPLNADRPGIPSNATNGGMAWAADNDRYTENKFKSWGRFRGFAEVHETVGEGTNEVTTVYRFFRGMHGDKISHSSTSTKSHQMSTPLASSTGYSTVYDNRALHGRPLESFIPNPSYPTGISSRVDWTVHRYVGVFTLGTDPMVRWIEDDITYSGNVGTYALIDRHYDGDGRLSWVKDWGATNSTFANTTDPIGRPDHNCTVNTYTNDSFRFPHGLLARTTFHNSSSCSTGLMSDVRYFYDGATPTNTPTSHTPNAGLMTAKVQMTGGGVVNDSATPVDRITESWTYEVDGYQNVPGWSRVLTSTDARGKVTTTSYVSHSNVTPTGQNRVHSLKTMTVTNALGQSTVTGFDVYGNNVSTTDPNGRTVEACYDRFGRLTHVLGPADPKPTTHHYSSNCSSTDFTTRHIYTRATIDPLGTWPNYAYSWSTTSDQRLDGTGSGIRTIRTRTILDGIGRSMQTQQHSPTGPGMILTRTVYGNAGETLRQSEPFYVTNTMPTAPTPVAVIDTQIPHESRMLYDWAGRTTRVDTLDNNSVLRYVTSSYTANNVTTSAPRTASWNPYSATTTVHDAHGNVISVTNGGDTSKYYYDRLGRMTHYFQPDTPNVSWMQYNYLGQRTSLDENDAGDINTVYFQNGEPFSVTDAENQTIFSKLDTLGRSRGTSLSNTSSNEWLNNRLTYFTYDPAGGIGAVQSAISYEPAGTQAFRATATDFDNHGRVIETDVVVYAGDDPETTGDHRLNDLITLETTYNHAGQPQTTTYPGRSGWSLTTPEIVAHQYNDLGLTQSATSPLGNYLNNQTYLNDAKPSVTQLRGGTGSVGVDITTKYTDEESRLRKIEARVIGGSNNNQLAVNSSFEWNLAGHITKHHQDPAGAASDERECFYYDNRQRLTRGFTTALSDSRYCPSSVANAINPTGTDPYVDIYTYNSQNDFVTNDGRTYNYATSVSGQGCTGDTDNPKPKAVSSIAAGPSGLPAEVFEYDCNGSMTERNQTIGGDTTEWSYAWDANNRLQATSSGEPVTWTNFVDTSVNSSGDLVTDPDVPGTSYSAGASSTETISQNGAVSFRSGMNPSPRQLVGLNDADNNTSFSEIEYQIYISSASAAVVYENGTNKGTIATGVQPDDIFTIHRDGTDVAYLVNGDVAYRSTTPATATTYVVDTAFYHPNRYITDVTITTNGTGVSRNIYDAVGQRVLRIDPDGVKIVYLGSIELRWTPGWTQLAASRTYPGGVRREFNGDLAYTVTGHQGSIVGQIDAATGTHATTRYTPYGDVRAGTTVDDKGFLNQTTDQDQGLTYLNNRSYDPATGVFVSVDPLVTETAQPYVYGAANPVRYSDPSGLCSVLSGNLWCSGSNYGPSGNGWMSVASILPGVDAWDAWGIWQNIGDSCAKCEGFDIDGGADNACLGVSGCVAAAEHLLVVTDGNAAAATDEQLDDARWIAANYCHQQECGEGNLLAYSNWAQTGAAGFGALSASSVADDILSVGARGSTASTTSVGRWMSEAEFKKMISSGRVVEGGGGRTFVVKPPNPNSYHSARPGSVFVEFDVPSGSLFPASKPAHRVIPGPNAGTARFGPLPSRMPPATNVCLRCR